MLIPGSSQTGKEKCIKYIKDSFLWISMSYKLMPKRLGTLLLKLCLCVFTSSEKTHYEGY